MFRQMVEDWSEGERQSRLLNLLSDAWVKRVTKEGAMRAKSNHTVKMMLNKEHHRKVVNRTRAKMARNFKRQSLRNALHNTALSHLDECEVGGQMIRLQAIPARMSWEDVLEWVGEEVLKEYKNIADNRGLQTSDRSVRQVGVGSDGEAVVDLAGVEGAKVSTMVGR